MLEIMLQTKKSSMQMSYLGEVPSASFITGAALATAISLTAGTAIAANASAGWLKFSYDNKILLIAKKPFRTGVSWDMLYAAGVVYGDDTNGSFQGSPAKLQNAKVTILGKVYRVRLMRIMDADVPITPNPGRELKDLFLKVLGPNSVAGLTTGEWASFSSSDLDISLFSWSIERYALQSTYMKNPISLGTNNAVNTQWRPVLELMS